MRLLLRSLSPYPPTLKRSPGWYAYVSYNAYEREHMFALEVLCMFSDSSNYKAAFKRVFTHGLALHQLIRKLHTHSHRPCGNVDHVTKQPGH